MTCGFPWNLRLTEMFVWSALEEEDDMTQYVAVVDETRTMSKEHARLDWTVTGWTLTERGIGYRLVSGIPNPASS